MGSEEELRRLKDNSMRALEEKIMSLREYARLLLIDRSRFDPNHLFNIINRVDLATNEHKQSSENYIAHLERVRK